MNHQQKTKLLSVRENDKSALKWNYQLLVMSLSCRMSHFSPFLINMAGIYT